MQMLYAYPQMMLRRQTFPPFIHPHWHLKTLPETLGNSVAISQLFAVRTPETQSFLWRMVAAEEERFREKLHSSSPHELHLCLEAMIIYMMMSMSELDSESKERTSRLFETAELIGSRFLDHTGSYSTTEISEPSSTWQDWIFAESRRRMSCLWLIIGCVITIENGKKCNICSDMRSLPLPSSKLLWEARSLEEWQTEKAFFDMSCPFMTLGELVEAKADAGNAAKAQRLQNWEMGSDKMTAMLNIAVERVTLPQSNLLPTRSITYSTCDIRISFFHATHEEGTKRKASDAAPTSDNDNQSQSLPPSPKRTQREASFLGISSGGHQDNTQHDQLAPPGDRPVINTEPEIELKLSVEQHRLLNTIVNDGRNVFFTGSAGSGKSAVLKTAISRLQGQDKRVKICAPTGRAAVPIEGTTAHAYMGWGPKMFEKGIPELRGACFQKTTKRRLRRTDVLIIDEVSMISSNFLNCMNECLKSVRADKKHLAFGGIQVIVTGDFCQLAPVKPFQWCYHCGAPTKFNSAEGLHACPKSRDHGPWADEDKWAFRSNAWAEANFACFNLRGIHRQNGPTFIKVLQKCRLGIPFTENDIDLLMNHDCEDDDAPQLLCTRDEVDPINHAKFQAITEYKPKQYTARDGFKWNEVLKWENEKFSKRLEDGTLAVHKDHQLDLVVDLKETMQVMLQVNLDIRAGLVNGSQGVICGWERIDLKKLPLLQEPYSIERELYVEPLLHSTYRLTPTRKTASGRACASAMGASAQYIPVA
ncbi:hypothetical protein FVER53590_13627 [Fusarium verticillioides]|nr:hypothetical protein FVER53590_13627 [Fusarium verticillioides]